MSRRHRSGITVTGLHPFLDLRESGFGDVIGGTLFTEDDGTLSFRFSHSLISDYVEDDWVGSHGYTVRSADNGTTWSAPEPVVVSQVDDPQRESSSFGPFFRTASGTVLYAGYHQVLDAAQGTQHQDMSLRDYLLLYARRERVNAEVRVEEWPPGTFLGEQFLEGGLQLASGRLVFTMWGIAERGENWRCGVLLSDDDGVSWRFRTVGYEPDLAIRNRPEQPAGYNEQTLFLTAEGSLVSIIRGREGLGRGVPGGGDRDTWFFRAVSRDDGETWSAPQPTDLPGTGATSGCGLTLADGSLLIGCRIPYSREYYSLPEPELFGLHLARSHDNGRSWQTEHIVQRDHEGNVFDTHHCAMNGIFRQLAADRFGYVFGFFGTAYEPKLQRVLELELQIDP